MNIRFVVGLVLGLIFGLMAQVNAQILWLGGVNDLNQLRLERSPGLSPIYSDSDPLETFDAKWSRPDIALFFIGGNTDPAEIGIVLEFASGPDGSPITPGYYGDTGWNSTGPTLWLSIPPQYGNFGDMALDPWMRNSLFIIHEVEFTDEVSSGDTHTVLNKFAADFFIGGSDTDDTKWLRGQLRFNSTYPVTSVIPEPETYALTAGIGLVGFGVVRRRFKK